MFHDEFLYIFAKTNFGLSISINRNLFRKYMCLELSNDLFHYFFRIKRNNNITFILELYLT